MNKFDQEVIMVAVMRLFSGILLLTLTFLCCVKSPITNNGTGSTTETAMVRGMLYLPDGKTPASGVRVHICPKNSLADTSGTGLSKRAAVLSATDSVVTDSAGRYAFDTTLDTGTYVIAGASGNNAVLIDSVPVKSKDTTVILPPDTLKPVGALKGVIRLSEGGDPRKVFILVFGVDRFARVDTSGYFKITGLAEGKYDLRLISSLDNYGVLDTNAVPIRSADTTDLDTISLPFTGIPTPKNVSLSYDTLKQIVTLVWSKADTALVKSYSVYRRNVGSNTVAVRINLSPVADTVYRDSTGVQDQTYEYVVAAVNSANMEGTKSAAVSASVSSAFKLLDSLYLGYSYGSSKTIYNGDSLLVDRTNDKITTIDTSLTILSSFDLPSGFGNGVGHGIDKANRVWASNYNTGRVNIYSITGILIDSITDTLLKFPTVLCASPDGRMFINSEVSPNVEQIRIYNDSARFISLFPNDSIPLSSKIADMFFDVQGNLTALDNVDSTITIYNTAGTLIKKQKLPSYTVEVKQLSNGYYIIKQDGGAGIIHLLDASFGLVSIFGKGLGFDYRDFGSIAVDAFDRLLVRRGNSVLLYRISK
jgi:hypothetical protein